MSGRWHETFFQQCKPSLLLIIFDGYCQGLPRAYQDDEFFASRDPRIQEVSLKEEIVLGKDRHDHDGIFASL